MDNKPSPQKPYRFSLVLDDEDRQTMNALKRHYGTDAQAVRIALRRLHKELSQ